MISAGRINNRYSISEFFKNTFLGYSQPIKMLEERIEQWIQWLSENELIIRLGCNDELYNSIPLEITIDENESWNDDVPTWINIAKDSDGISLENDPETISKAPKSLKFNLASDWEENSIQPNASEPLVMTYEASEFGRLVNRMYLDPTSGLLLRNGLRRAVRRVFRNDEDIPFTEEGLLYLISSTDDFMNFWWKDSEYEKLLEKASIIAVSYTHLTLPTKRIV